MLLAFIALFLYCSFIFLFSFLSPVVSILCLPTNTTDLVNYIVLFYMMYMLSLYLVGSILFPIIQFSCLSVPFLLLFQDIYN